MKATDRFLQYVKVYTTSDDAGDKTPSTQRQFDLANTLCDEMLAMGFDDARVSDDCFVYASLPATPGLERAPCVGLIAHIDTAPDFCGENVNPQIVENYDGGDVTLPATGDVLSPERFPWLKKLAGKTLITTDGTTLLGADDKAGIAEILTACEALIRDEIPHGRIAVAFTPDEEIGMGVHSFDVERFGADFAYTVDGGDLGDLNYENFNACAATVRFQGLSVHPGSSKDTMVNASLLAMQFNAMLPACDTPRDTQKREGFFHLTDMKGDVETAELRYIVRDHDAARFEARKDTLAHIAEIMNRRWGDGAVTLEVREQYRNMIERIRPRFEIVEYAREAMRLCGMEPSEDPIRGGTDGAQLCYMGLPCPNLCTGGHACHGKYEHIAAEDMEAVAAMLVELVKLVAKGKQE